MAFYQRLNPRLFVLTGLLALLFIVLLGGLAWQQLWRGSDYERLERRQTLRRILQPGPRGRILDRNGVPLVVNQPHFSVVLYLDEMRKEFNDKFDQLRKEWLAKAHDDTSEVHPTLDRSKLYKEARLAVVHSYLDRANALLGQPTILNEKALEQHIEQKPLLPFTLIANISATDFARFNEEIPVESPMQTRVEAQRSYPFDSMAFHTLGRVGLTNEYDETDWPIEDLPKFSTFPYRGMTGLDGLEKLKDDTLSGKSGGEIWVVDPAYSRIQRVAQQTPQSGTDFVSSLDVNLQKVAEQQLSVKNDLVGCAVALDVRTGEVLALANKPDFNLNETVPSISQKLLDEMNTSDEGWYNRATQVTYPAGSTFKIVTTIAGLRAGILDGNTILDCPGMITIGGLHFQEDTYKDNPGGYGKIGLVFALRVSSDVFFYKSGLNIGPKLIAKEARDLGLGKPTGIELPEASNARMIVQDPDWKKAHHYGSWTDGDTANLAIGQGYLLVSPLQMACLIASVARDEKFTKPTLIHNPNLPPDTIIHSEPLGLTPEQRKLLIDGLEEAATEGTGHSVHERVPNIRVAGKTGTAQWTEKGQKLTVAWFVCFAPVENPRIAIAVAVQSPDPNLIYYGGPTCGPIAGEILKEYFKRHPETTNQNVPDNSAHP